jgi:hypothetical protein
MSYQYQQYPQYQMPGGQQLPIQPPAAAAPTAGTGPTYIPLAQYLPPESTWGHVQSQQAINNAAGADPLQLFVQVPDPTSAAKQYPRLMYNAKTRDMHVVRDDQEMQKYTGLGYSKDPFPAEPLTK